MSDYTTFSVEMDADGIAVMKIDVPNQGMNVWDEALMAEFPKFVDAFVTDDSIKGLVIASGRDNGFMAGADLRMLEKQTGELIAFLYAEDFPNGLDDAIKDWRGPLKGIALLSAAQKYQDAKHNAEALSEYQKVSDDNDVPAELRGMGTIMAVRLNEGITADEKMEQLKAVVNDSDSPWRHHAAMESALIQAHQKNDYAAAMGLLDSIEKAELAPASMKEKAKKLGHVYSVMMHKNASVKNDGEEG